MIAIRPLTVHDLPLGLRLCRQAGWNQTVADWRRFLDLEPDGCFVAEWDGTPVGTTAAFVFGPVAWIAAVLVAQEYRSRGLGRALMNHALAYAEKRGARSIRLDATPLGQPLYASLGFVEQYRLARYAGTLGAASAAPEVEAALPRDWERLTALDAEVTGTDRSRLLPRLFAEAPGEVRLVRKDGEVRGFRCARHGAHALQLGPCIAAPDAGASLCSDAFHRHAGTQVYLDVPRDHAAAGLALAHGLVVQRELVRMCRGEPCVERRDWLWASSGPEKG
jgi:GNAT superfamily N-acetyltransferase